MTKTEEIPRFGLLCGYRVVLIGLSVAGPFAAELYADHGADVIWIEHPTVPDMGRVSGHGGEWQQNRRNMRSIAMNYMKEEGREAFLKLIETADVLIEASVGGRFERAGLGDDVLWGRNPRLVIAHVSGFGQTGDPLYVRRASYDPIAQAFGCAMRMNGLPGQPSMPAMPFPGCTAACHGGERPEGRPSGWARSRGDVRWEITSNDGASNVNVARMLLESCSGNLAALRGATCGTTHVVPRRQGGSL